MRHPVLVGLGVFLSFAIFLGGCAGGGMGPKVRVATATAAELKAVEGQDNVWYEFQPGDVVPVHVGFFGVVEGGAEGPAVFRAKQQFYFVMFKDRPMQISFDGKTFASPNANQTLIAVIPRKDGNGAQLGWLIYMGESGDPHAELNKLIEKAPAEPKSEEAPPQTQ